MKNYIPWTMSPSGEERFRAELERIRAEMRARRALRRHAWDEAKRLSDTQYDHNTERYNNGEGEV